MRALLSIQAVLVRRMYSI